MTQLRMAGVLAVAIGPLFSTMAHATPFLGQVLTTGENFCPLGWAEMDGQLLSISTNADLYNLIGNTFGGSVSQGTFALPAALPQFTATNVPLHQCINLNGTVPTRP